MEPSDYLAILRKRWVTIALFAVLGLAAGLASSIGATPMYRATAKVFVATERGESVGELVQGSTFVQNTVASYAQLATMPIVLQPVIDTLGLDTTPRALARSVSADAPLNLVIIEITAVSASPTRAADIANAVSTQLTKAVAATSPAAASGSPSLKLTTISQATAPTYPFAPSTKMNVATRLLLGIAIGVVIAVLRELLDTKVRTVKDVRRVTDTAVLGEIMRDSSAKQHPAVSLSQPQSPRAEAYRRLRTNLRFLNVSGAPRSIVVTSALPGEGKSTTAVNLAITMAKSDTRVLLVDADLRRPSVADYLGLEGAAGLTSVLIGAATLEDVIQQWGDGNLDVLTAGEIPPNPSELLGSVAMSDVLAAVVDSYDVVLIDSAPLLPVTDSALLSRLTDGALVVVNCGRTNRAQLTDALGTLDAVGAHVFGLVLNRVSRRTRQSYYTAELGSGRKRRSRTGAALPVAAAVAAGDAAQTAAGRHHARLSEAAAVASIPEPHDGGGHDGTVAVDAAAVEV